MIHKSVYIVSIEYSGSPKRTCSEYGPWTKYGKTKYKPEEPKTNIFVINGLACHRSLYFPLCKQGMGLFTQDA